jgi:hypothetical protein
VRFFKGCFGFIVDKTFATAANCWFNFASSFSKLTRKEAFMAK